MLSCWAASWFDDREPVPRCRKCVNIVAPPWIVCILEWHRSMQCIVSCFVSLDIGQCVEMELEIYLLMQIYTTIERLQYDAEPRHQYP